MEKVTQNTSKFGDLFGQQNKQREIRRLNKFICFKEKVKIHDLN